MIFNKPFLFFCSLLLSITTNAELISIEESELSDISGSAGLEIDISTDLDGFQISHEDESVLGESDQSLLFAFDNLELTATGISLDVAATPSGNALVLGLPEVISLNEVNISFDAETPQAGNIVTVGPPTPVNYDISFNVDNDPFECTNVAGCFTLFGTVDLRNFNRAYDFSLDVSTPTTNASLHSLTRLTGPTDTNGSDDIYSWNANPSPGPGGPEAGTARLTLDKGDIVELTIAVEGCDVNGALSLGGSDDSTCAPPVLDVVINGSTLTVSGAVDDNDVNSVTYNLGFLGPRDDEWVTYTVSNLEILDLTVSGNLYSNGSISVFGQ